MKSNNEGLVSLELIDLIRINQLVRNYIDFDKFEKWYNSLSVLEQSALTTTLCDFSYQAEFDEATYNEALKEAGIDSDNSLVKYAVSFYNKRRRYLDIHSFYKWLIQLQDVERFVVFRNFVYLFGKAEGIVYRHETKEGCNHWWHRNLLDEKVVQSLLDNPKYYSTSLKDDDLLK